MEDFGAKYTQANEISILRPLESAIKKYAIFQIELSTHRQMKSVFCILTSSAIKKYAKYFADRTKYTQANEIGILRPKF